MNGPGSENRPRQGMDYGETREVHDTHAAIIREKAEPRIGREPLSLWLIAIYGTAVFFGGAYLGQLRHLSSGERSRCGRAVSTTGGFGNCEWRLASAGDDCAQGSARSADGEGSALRLGGNAAVGQDFERSKDRGRSHLRPTGVGK